MWSIGNFLSVTIRKSITPSIWLISNEKILLGFFVSRKKSSVAVYSLSLKVCDIFNLQTVCVCFEYKAQKDVCRHNPQLGPAMTITAVSASFFTWQTQKKCAFQPSLALRWQSQLPLLLFSHDRQKIILQIQAQLVDFISLFFEQKDIACRW